MPAGWSLAIASGTRATRRSPGEVSLTTAAFMRLPVSIPRFFRSLLTVCWGLRRILTISIMAQLHDGQAGEGSTPQATRLRGLSSSGLGAQQLADPVPG